MLREIERAVEAMKAIPAEYHSLVLAEVAGKGKKKPGPKKGYKRKPGAKKPGPKPGFKKKKTAAENMPVKVIDTEAKLAKLRKLKAKVSE